MYKPPVTHNVVGLPGLLELLEEIQLKLHLLGFGEDVDIFLPNTNVNTLYCLFDAQRKFTPFEQVFTETPFSVLVDEKKKLSES